MLTNDDNYCTLKLFEHVNVNCDEKIRILNCCRDNQNSNK